MAAKFDYITEVNNILQRSNWPKLEISCSISRVDTVNTKKYPRWMANAKFDDIVFKTDIVHSSKAKAKEDISKQVLLHLKSLQESPESEGGLLSSNSRGPPQLYKTKKKSCGQGAKERKSEIFKKKIKAVLIRCPKCHFLNFPRYSRCRFFDKCNGSLKVEERRIIFSDIERVRGNLDSEIIQIAAVSYDYSGNMKDAYSTFLLPSVKVERGSFETQKIHSLYTIDNSVVKIIDAKKQIDMKMPTVSQEVGIKEFLSFIRTQNSSALFFNGKDAATLDHAIRILELGHVSGVEVKGKKLKTEDMCTIVLNDGLELPVINSQPFYQEVCLTEFDSVKNGMATIVKLLGDEELKKKFEAHDALADAYALGEISMKTTKNSIKKQFFDYLGHYCEGIN